MSRPIPFNFAATGIGSVPFLDVEEACREILGRLSLVPYWPQLVNRSFLEDMSAQYSEGLPLLEIDEGNRRLALSETADRETELVTFYEHFFDQDEDYFAISETFAPGLHRMAALLEEGELPDAPCVKGQTVGPVTFTQGIAGRDGKSILHDSELTEAMVNGLAIKAVWQVRRLADSGKQPLLFLDEPVLSGFGSAFSALQREDVVRMLRATIDSVRAHTDALIGIHCCGNTDWSMIMDAHPDIISFDAYDFMDYFLLFTEGLSQFLRKGGMVAWGIIPTSGRLERESVDSLLVRLRKGIDAAAPLFGDPHVLAARSMITPSCGMGTMDPEAAHRAIDLLSRLADSLKTG